MAAAALGASIPGGALVNALDAATGGTSSAWLTVQLEAATKLTLSPVQFMRAVGSAGANTIAAKAANQTLPGGLGHRAGRHRRGRDV